MTRPKPQPTQAEARAIRASLTHQAMWSIFYSTVAAGYQQKFRVAQHMNPERSAISRRNFLRLGFGVGVAGAVAAGTDHVTDETEFPVPHDDEILDGLAYLGGALGAVAATAGWVRDRRALRAAGTAVEQEVVRLLQMPSSSEHLSIVKAALERGESPVDALSLLGETELREFRALAHEVADAGDRSYVAALESDPELREVARDLGGHEVHSENVPRHTLEVLVGAVRRGLDIGSSSPSSETRLGIG